MANDAARIHGSRTSPATALPSPAAVAARTPRVHAITGAVSAAFVADVLLALGTEPVLTHYPAELPEMLARADALLVNMGQPDDARIQAARMAAQLAAQQRIPWVLDPAHAHSAPARLARARQLLQLKPAVFKPNGAELSAFRKALDLPERPALPERIADHAALPPQTSSAFALATRLDTVVLTTGVTDIATDGRRVIAIAGGHPHMHRAVGFGCALGAATAAFLVIAPPLQAAAAAAAAFDRAAAMAARTAKGPAGFRIAFVDALATLTEPPEKEGSHDGHG